jgi:hypothetical protein
LLNSWYDRLINLYQGLTDPGNASTYTTNIYGCQFWYFFFLPNMGDCIYGFHGEGFFPLKRMTTDFSTMIGAADAMQVPVDFHIDYFREYYSGQNKNTDIKRKGESLSRILFKEGESFSTANTLTSPTPEATVDSATKSGVGGTTSAPGAGSGGEGAGGTGAGESDYVEDGGSYADELAKDPYGRKMLDLLGMDYKDPSGSGGTGAGGSV